MGARSDIDRLIELGLNRYGAGDLDGALLMWEEALAVDPDNAQANSYVDYVRLNYELLSSGEPELVTDGGAPFAIEEEPEYHIEIQAGEETSPRISSPIRMDPLDSGWFMEGEQTLDAGAPTMPEPEPEQVMLELEADEPPLPEVSFEDATREYHGAAQQAAMPMLTMPPDFPAAAEFGDEHTGGFTNEGTPIGFGTQETEIRKRDFGFVQPVAAKSKALAASPMSIGSAPTMDIAALERTQERDPFGGGTDKGASDDDDLIGSLPSPRPAVAEQAQPPVGKVSTRDLPIAPRPPAPRDSSAHSQAEVMLSHTPTQDFELAKESARIDVGAPTRELGLRPSRPVLSNPDDDDAPTGQSDARAIREAASRHDGGATRPGTESTRHDIVLPFDPIDARSAQILDDVDVDAPPDEPEEDQTRRRITTLLERAIAWNEAADLDRAVTAVDLALSENPNSALGQKLITRNRDTIMQVFQAFLGDLERTPQMARPLHELANAPISPRAAFLLSRIDGTLTIDELLDVSGMPRLEAYRHLCQLILRGILR